MAGPQATPAPADDLAGAAVASAVSWPLDRDAFWPVLAWALTSALGVLVFASVLRRPDLVFELAGSPFLVAGARRRRDRERPRPLVAGAAAVAVMDAPAPAPDTPAVEPLAAPDPAEDPVAAPVVDDTASSAPMEAPADEPDSPAAETPGAEAAAVAPAGPETVAGPTEDVPVVDGPETASVNDDAPLAAAAAARAAMIAGAKRPPLKFTGKAGKGVQRGKIGYRQVRVSAGPDDVRTAEVGRVDLKDEVELIGEDESFFQIRTPEGVEGWVPRYVIRGFTTSSGK